jgi:DNA-binding MarR family transcriptional regulator
MSKAASFETTLHVRDNCLCLAAQRAARSLARRFDEALRPAGLTSGQFSLLTSLNRPQPPSIGEVASVLGMDRTTLTANLKPLERRGLLETLVDPADRRGRLVRLTGEGLAALDVATPIWVRVHADVEALLDQPSGVRTALHALA